MISFEIGDGKLNCSKVQSESTVKFHYPGVLATLSCGAV